VFSSAGGRYSLYRPETAPTAMSDSFLPRQKTNTTTAQFSCTSFVEIKKYLVC